MKNSKFYGLRGTKLNIAIAVVAGTDFALFGYDQGVMGGLLTLPSFLRYFPQIDTVNPPPGSSSSYVATIQAITVGAYTLGCFFGAVVTIWLGNMLGRKRTIFWGSVIMIIGAVLQTSSYGLPQLIVGRWVTGFGNGMNTSTVPTWQSETSKPHRRGQMVMIEGSLIVFGVMLSYWLDLGFSFLEPSSIAWRFPIGFQIILAVFILIAIPGLPESPRWLILKGREDEALDVLAALSNLPPEDKKIQQEFLAVKDVVFEMSKGGFRECFKMNRNRNFHRTVLGYVNQVFQQISGINLVTYYAATIFENSLGMSPFMSRLLSACNGTEYFMASWIAIFTIEKFGRRSLMIFGAAGMSVSMAILAGATSKIGDTSLGLLATVMLFVFNSFFAVGWLGMTWLYPAEVTPLSIRAPANAISTTANWIFNFLVVMITPPAFATIGYKTYIIFAVINAAIVPSVYFFFPETAYRSLEEMDEIFHQTTNAFDVIKVAQNMPHRYDKRGNLLIEYGDTEEAREVERRRSSVTGADVTHRGGILGGEREKRNEVEHREQGGL
ncbi:MFS sugar transporter-like protein [Dothidotthia symphoricarpi CBS 119687]|uniref:MFS sugar transporter-like protein n=1 Tax=Dothidotthia symphoricarpi CBS 119687 TaxID=1392245 RepID=A0A6A6AEP7_9PLEO|nr:MFS sugar transporter-like protein [Dothidotthia symphoricarpi CBS 119687]KAF2128881.1 MFS sugar transporter-like protein [Dothidotthia symphoricarpi CBS 119687]